MNPILILAQTGSTELDFIRQIPAGAMMTLCLSGVALIVALVFIVRARTQRSQQGTGDTSQTAADHPMMPVTGVARPSDDDDDDLSLDDLPDLDSLVDTPQPKPAVAQAPVPAPPTRTAPAGTYSLQVSNGETAQAVEVVTILRDVMDGGLIIQMGDKVYRNLGSDETFKSRFLTIMRELSPMVTQASKSKTVDELASSPDTPEPEPVATPDAGAASLRDLLVDDEPEPPPAAVPPPAIDGKMPGDLPRFSMDEEPKTIKKRAGLLGRTKTEFVPVPELDLAGAIEAYLQHKLAHLPDFNQRSIHVHPSPDGGVSIEVDGQYYDAVGEVDDQAVRSLLAQTIQEWQERNAGN